MRRRALLTGAATVAMGTGISLRSAAQGARAKRIGVLTTLPRDHPDAAPFWAMAADELKRLGWEEGRNLALDVRPSMGDPAKLRADAEQLVAAKVDLIHADHNGGVSAAMQATKTIPIVMIADAATEHGFAQSLARPGGNVTGVVFLAHDEIGRVLSLLREMRPGLARIGMSINLDNPIGKAYFSSWNTVVTAVGIKLSALPVMRELADVAPSLQAAQREQVQALLLPILPLLNANSPAWDQINAWAIEHKVVTRGSLLARGKSVVTFGANVEALVRLAQAQIDRVLRGANPAVTPIMQPTVFDVVVNQKLARAVGWPAPTSVLLQATEVIE
jgi:putative ABC transport system substrate-binding protein